MKFSFSHVQAPSYIPRSQPGKVSAPAQKAACAANSPDREQHLGCASQSVMKGTVGAATVRQGQGPRPGVSASRACAWSTGPSRAALSNLNCLLWHQYPHNSKNSLFSLFKYNTGSKFVTKPFFFILMWILLFLKKNYTSTLKLTFT